MDTKLQKYMALLKTVEYGSFTKAAEVLHYSQSGISRMISDLEKEWNLSVLERGRSGVRLTSDGVKMLPFVQNVCREYQNLQDQVDQLQGLESGLIRIGTISSIATHWLPSRRSRKIIPISSMNCCRETTARLRSGSLREGWTAVFFCCRLLQNWKSPP